MPQDSTSYEKLNSLPSGPALAERAVVLTERSEVVILAMRQRAVILLIHNYLRDATRVR